jgi:hypothetical protein
MRTPSFADFLLGFFSGLSVGVVITVVVWAAFE